VNHRTHHARHAARLSFALGLGLFFSACWPLSMFNGCLTSEPPRPPPKPGSFTYELSCDTAIGTVKSWVTYTVQASSEPVFTGQEVDYEITAPLAEVDSPVTTTFESSVETFEVPEGLEVESVAAVESSNADFSSAVAKLEDGKIVFTLEGSFEFDDTERAVPPFRVHAKVVGTLGKAIVWMPPREIDGKASAGFFGEQSSTCTFETPGPIWTSHVD